MPTRRYHEVVSRNERSRVSQSTIGRRESDIKENKKDITRNHGPGKALGVLSFSVMAFWRSYFVSQTKQARFLASLLNDVCFVCRIEMHTNLDGDLHRDDLALSDI